MKTLLVLVAAAMASATAMAHEFTVGALKIDHPWSRETAANATTAAGFLTIQNFGKTPDRLIAIKTAASGSAEVHTMTMEGGVMRMRPLRNGLPIAPGHEVKLQPGAEHIMFMDLKAPVQKGKDLTATLVFERAGEVTVTFDIEAMGATPQPASHNH